MSIGLRTETCAVCDDVQVREFSPGSRVVKKKVMSSVVGDRVMAVSGEHVSGEGHVGASPVRLQGSWRGILLVCCVMRQEVRGGRGIGTPK